MKDKIQSVNSKVLYCLAILTFMTVAHSEELFVYCKVEDPRFKLSRPVTLFKKGTKKNAKPFAYSQFNVELVPYGMPKSMRDKMEPIYGKQIEGKKFIVQGFEF